MQFDMFLLKDPKITKTRAVSSNTRVYNGRLTSVTSPTSLQSMKVNKLGISLAKNSSIKIEPQMDNDLLALEILSAIGCSQVTDKTVNKSNFSLLTQQTDTETIDNPNKIDTNAFASIAKGKVKFDKIIKDENNNFFRLDQQIPDNYQKQQEDIKMKKPREFGFVVESLYDINFLNAKVPTLRGLKRIK